MVLPAPLAPLRTANSPLSIANDTSLSAGNRRGPVPEDLRHAQEAQHGGLPTFYLTTYSFESFSTRSEFTTAGFARPPVAFITWPTRNPIAAFLPALVVRHHLRLGGQHLVHDAGERPRVRHLGQPLARHDGLGRLPGAVHLLEDVLGDPAADRPVVDQREQAAQVRRRDGAAATASSPSPGSSRSSSSMHPVGGGLGVPCSRATASK